MKSNQTGSTTVANVCGAAESGDLFDQPAFIQTASPRRTNFLTPSRLLDGSNVLSSRREAGAMET